jgi:hypothetical protein
LGREFSLSAHSLVAAQLSVDRTSILKAALPCIAG